MEEWLSRTSLLVGEESLARLQKAHVLVVGVGGVGAYAAEMIVRAGVGEITLLDADTVEESNLNRQLVALGAAGVVATHDLVLGSLADEYPGTVTAVCFESEIIDDELHFDYRLREGIARHMNACFLMEQMDIIPRNGEKNIESTTDPAK